MFCPHWLRARVKSTQPSCLPQWQAPGVKTMDGCARGPTGGSQASVALLLSQTLVAYYCFLFQSPPLSVTTPYLGQFGDFVSWCRGRADCRLRSGVWLDLFQFARAAFFLETQAPCFVSSICVFTVVPRLRENSCAVVRGHALGPWL